MKGLEHLGVDSDMSPEAKLVLNYCYYNEINVSIWSSKSAAAFRNATFGLMALRSLFNRK